MLTRGKYIVYKNDVGYDYSVPPARTRLEEGTFFLLKDQDALGSMTLRSYAANALQILDWGIDPTTGEPLTDDQKEQLSLRADGAHMLANAWAKKLHKIPD